MPLKNLGPVGPKNNSRRREAIDDGVELEELGVVSLVTREVEDTARPGKKRKLSPCRVLAQGEDGHRADLMVCRMGELVDHLVWADPALLERYPEHFEAYAPPAGRPPTKALHVRVKPQGVDLCPETGCLLDLGACPEQGQRGHRVEPDSITHYTTNAAGTTDVHLIGGKVVTAWQAPEVLSIAKLKGQENRKTAGKHGRVLPGGVVRTPAEAKAKSDEHKPRGGQN
jgi:hypothetical protein